MDVHETTSYLYTVLGGLTDPSDKPEVVLPTEAVQAIEHFRIISQDDTRKTHREIAFVSVVGSVNYETNDVNSDFDYKATYFPCLDDFYHQSFPKFNIVTDEFDCSLAPIHEFRKHMMKGNINFFEPLYAKAIAVNPALENFWDIMRLLVEMNVKEALLASYFTAGNRMKRVTTMKEDFVHKDAAFAIRVLHFVQNLILTGEFKVVPSDEVKSLIALIRAGECSFEMVTNLYDDYNAEVTGQLFKSFEGGGKFVFSDAVHDLDKTDTKDFQELNHLADKELIDALREFIR